MRNKMPGEINISRMTYLTLLCGLFGCASTTTAIVEKLDPATSVTFTAVKTPLVLYRETPARAAFARDYAYLGPIRANRSGIWRYFIWVGSWATLQRSDVSGHRDSFESIVIFADGEPLLLELSGWTPAAVGSSESIYRKPVASATDAYYLVDVDQLRIIAGARDIRLQTKGSPAREYALWDEQHAARRGLREFLEGN